MNVLDILIASILLVAFIAGYNKGLIRSLVSFLRFFISGYFAIRFAYLFIPYLTWLGPQDNWVYYFVAFIVALLVIGILLWFIAKFLSAILDALSLGIVNRLFGGLLGSLKYAFLISLIFLVINKLQGFDEESFVTKLPTESSTFYEPISKLAPALLPVVTDFLIQEKENL